MPGFDGIFLFYPILQYQHRGNRLRSPQRLDTFGHGIIKKLMRRGGNEQTSSKHAHHVPMCSTSTHELADGMEEGILLSSQTNVQIHCNAAFTNLTKEQF